MSSWENFKNNNIIYPFSVSHDIETDESTGIPSTSRSTTTRNSSVPIDEEAEVPSKRSTWRIIVEQPIADNISININSNSKPWIEIKNSQCLNRTYNPKPLNQQASERVRELKLKNPELLPPPDSLTSAPPSYSFVLRQIAASKRPRVLGTFIHSSSYVLHLPPPNYAAAFDVYVDDPLPHQPRPRVYTFGFTPMLAICPHCGLAGVTVTRCKVTICTHVCALLLCVMLCWICVPLPYIMTSCKDVYHYCRHCRRYMGVYCPTRFDGVPTSTRMQETIRDTAI